METTAQLSELAEAIIDGYWILCEPADVVARAIDEFAEHKRVGRPFTYGDDREATAEELIMALDEVVCYFEGRQLWRADYETDMALARENTRNKVSRLVRYLRRTGQGRMS